MVNQTTARVLLIGWETTGWPLVDPLLAKGCMPHLAKLIAEGQKATLLHHPPLLPSALWSTLLTGVSPLVHGIVADREMRPDGSGLQPIGRPAQHATTIWRHLEAAGIPTAVVGFPATHPSEPLSSVCVSDRWRSTDTDDQAASVQPVGLQAAMNDLRIAPDEIDLATLRTFLPNANNIASNDPRPVILRQCLAQTASWHAVATEVVGRNDWRFAAVHYPGLAPLCQHFLPYHAPVARGVTEHDARCYGDIITAAYRFHDMMLGRLIGLAGNDTAVVLVSNHGVSCGPNRPASTPKTLTQVMSGLRREAVAVIAGADQAQQPSIIHATDLAAIVLSLFGVKTPDQSSRPLAGQREQPSDATKNQPPTEDRSVEYLLSLGYTEKPDGYARAAVNRLEADQKHILALACREYGQMQRAIGILEKLVRQFPNTTEYAISLAELYAGIGEVEDFGQLVDRLAQAYPTSPIAKVGLGIAAMLRGDHDQAITVLAQADESATEPMPWLLVEAGRAMLKMKSHGQAIELFTKAIEHDDSLADAHAGLASAQLVGDDIEAAILSSQKAVTLRPYDARLMQLHGEALMADNRDRQARHWLEDALHADPYSVQTIRSLARVCERLGDQTRADDLRDSLMLIQFHHTEKQRLGFDTALRTRG